jgi:glutathione S-transferase
MDPNQPDGLFVVNPASMTLLGGGRSRESPECHLCQRRQRTSSADSLTTSCPSASCAARYWALIDPGPTFLALNPFGEIPIYEEDGLRLRDAQAILIYVAGKHDPTRGWWPADAASQGRISQWLSTGGNEIMSAAGARLVKLLKYDLDLKKLQDRANSTFKVLETQLSGREWLELDHPTIADIACFPYTALAGEGEISLQPYSHVRAWIERIKKLPRFIPMPGI